MAEKNLRMMRAWATAVLLAVTVIATDPAAAKDGSAVDMSAVERVLPKRPTIPARVFRLSDFGAVGDGRAMDTEAFAKAIAAVRRAGGGRLVVPAGRYRVRSVQLCSNLDLHLEAGAVIAAPDNFADFGMPDPATLHSQDEVKAKVRFPLAIVSGRHLHDVAITGDGVFDGKGALWWAWSERAARARPGRLVYRRPNLLVIDGCERLLVADITLRNSPKFHLVPRHVRDLTIERVKVRAPDDAPNTDAIDPGPVTNALIRGCDLDTGDDDIVIKSGGRNVLIEDCTIRHGHGISIGSETTEGVDGMLVRRCTFDGTDNGIRIKSMRGAGGLVRNVRYTDIRMKNVGDAMVLDLTYTDNNRPNFKGEPGRVPAIRDVLIDHVTVEGAKHAGRIVGLPESRITGITLRDVSITAADDFVVRDADAPVFENVTRTIKAPAAAK
ncbi:MAG TPA: glycosyl hydrolase family 28 protein [Opitutus sp.]|nr:glycosyl hydrolase family 28 protein [Opitutus sp.]